MTIEHFRKRFNTLAARGYSKEQATRIAELPDDIIEEKDGICVVRDENGDVVAKT